MVEGQVKEQRLARDGLESWWKVHEVGLLSDEGRVQAKGLKPFNQRLEDRSKSPSEGPGRPLLGWAHSQLISFSYSLRVHRL